ncbi:MAG TPA: hypothetical protein VHJ59_08780 [Nitrososphaera sp.]|nr:hypothetical protein [Nitrososphaera sp.]
MLFAFSILGFALTFTVAVSANLSVFVLVIPLIFMIIDLLLVRVGRVRKEVYPEEVVKEEDKERTRVGAGEDERKK